MYQRVYVEITNICNMQCSFCHGHSRTPKQMSEKEFSQILRELKGKTKNIYYHLMGEPLAHPKLPLFMKMAKEEGFRSLITTNGTLLKKRGKEILESGLYKINISLHSFEKEDNLKQEEYLSEVASFALEAWEKGVIVVLRLWNKGVDGGKNQEILDYLRLKLSGEWEENEKGIKIRNRLHVEWGDRFEWPDMNASLYGDKVFCYGTRDHFGILVDGSVVPCCLDSEGTINLGNVFEEALSDILASPRVLKMKRGFGSHQATEELCKHCEYARRFD